MKRTIVALMLITMISALLIAGCEANLGQDPNAMGTGTGTPAMTTGIDPGMTPGMTPIVPETTPATWTQTQPVVTT